MMRSRKDSAWTFRSHRRVCRPMRLGFGLVEIVIATSIVGVAMISFTYVFLLSDRLTVQASNKVRANFIAEENLEAMRFLRDMSWSVNIAPLTVGTAYYPSFNTVTSAWSVSDVPPALTDGIFTRSILLQNVNRDSSDNIVLSGGTLDPGSRKVITTVSWPDGSVTVETYLNNVFNK